MARDHERSIPSPSIRAIASIAGIALLPVRGVSADRNRVSPNPRSVGMIVRSPASCSAGNTASQVEESSGQPCSKSTGAPSRGPVSA